VAKFAVFFAHRVVYNTFYGITVYAINMAKDGPKKIGRYNCMGGRIKSRGS
jgi:hypothetical protein